MDVLRSLHSLHLWYRSNQVNKPRASVLCSWLVSPLDLSRHTLLFWRRLHFHIRYWCCARRTRSYPLQRRYCRDSHLYVDFDQQAGRVPSCRYYQYCIASRPPQVKPTSSDERYFDNRILQCAGYLSFYNCCGRRRGGFGCCAGFPVCLVRCHYLFLCCFAC